MSQCLKNWRLLVSPRRYSILQMGSNRSPGKAIGSACTGGIDHGGQPRPLGRRGSPLARNLVIQSSFHNKFAFCGVSVSSGTPPTPMTTGCSHRRGRRMPERSGNRGGKSPGGASRIVLDSVSKTERSNCDSRARSHHVNRRTQTLWGRLSSSKKRCGAVRGSSPPTTPGAPAKNAKWKPDSFSRINHRPT
jgi:hypothetical protein